MSRMLLYKNARRIRISMRDDGYDGQIEKLQREVASLMEVVSTLTALVLETIEDGDEDADYKQTAAHGEPTTYGWYAAVKSYSDENCYDDE